MTTPIIYLSKDRRRSKERHFLRRAKELGEMYGVQPIPAHDGDSLLRACRALPGGVTRLVLLCHGGPTWFLRSDRGAHRWRLNMPDQVPVTMVAEALADRLDVSEGPARICLAACLTARSPRWYLTQLYGGTVSQWGPESYRRGGVQSIAALLRDALCRLDTPVVVAGHCVAGEALTAPLGRDFGPVVGEPGVSWYEMEYGTDKTSLSDRRRWVRFAKGNVAMRYLLDGVR